MLNNNFYQLLLVSWFFVAAFTFVALLFTPAPYGRHSRPGWGPPIQARFGWMIMESVSFILFIFFFSLGAGNVTFLAIFILCLWILHYIQRSFIYPFLMKNGRKPMALSVVGMAVFFNTVNSYLNGMAVSAKALSYSLSWAGDPRFIIGTLLFFAGFFVNIHSDAKLRKLRTSGSDEYRVPSGGFFRLVSSANYFGEIVEWCGWACLTWTWAGLSFAVWTAANLIPRALTHHRWYREKFQDYPGHRKAVFPYLL
jgi:3-oxo-5-alpha-steroid 4-dehydrogenase 1